MHRLQSEASSSDRPFRSSFPRTKARVSPARPSSSRLCWRRIPIPPRPRRTPEEGASKPMGERGGRSRSDARRALGGIGSGTGARLFLLGRRQAGRNGWLCALCAIQLCTLFPLALSLWPLVPAGLLPRWPVPCPATPLLPRSLRRALVSSAEGSLASLLLSFSVPNEPHHRRRVAQGGAGENPNSAGPCPEGLAIESVGNRGRSEERRAGKGVDIESPGPSSSNSGWKLWKGSGEAGLGGYRKPALE